MTERVVTIRNPAGHALYCVLHEPPAGRRSDVACVLLSPGVKMRVAPHRLYRKIADVFLERGMPVLRVDFHGLGDSEGDLPEDRLDQLYRSVQLGRHVPDVRAAIDWLQAELGIRRVIGGGLCGGALTALLAAESDPRIESLYALGIPVILDGSGSTDTSKNMTSGQLAQMRQGYLKKLGSREAWMRLFSMRSDFRAIVRSLTVSLRGLTKRFRGRGSASEGVPAPATPPADNLNPRFPRAFFHLLRTKRPALLIFSGADRLQFEYQEKFAQPWAAALAPYSSLIRCEVVPKANHVLADPRWIAAAREHTVEWLNVRYGAHEQSRRRLEPAAAGAG